MTKFASADMEKTAFFAVVNGVIKPFVNFFCITKYVSANVEARFQGLIFLSRRKGNGTILIGVGPTRNGREHAPKEVTDLVQRWSSLGDTPFEERVEETDWEVALIIPYAVFFKHQIESLDEKEIKANFYKCGDELQTPHFLSWNPIKIEKPDFHRPDFFGTLEFE